MKIDKFIDTMEYYTSVKNKLLKGKRELSDTL